MSKGRVRQVTLHSLVLLQLIILHSSLIYSLSISSNNKNNVIAPNNNNNLGGKSTLQQQSTSAAQQQAPSTNNGQPNQQQLAAPQQQITTLTPPMTTTSNHGSYLDTVSAQQQVTKQQQQQQQTESIHSSNELRANTEEHDDSVPLATVNNHSRNNQPAARPPQYVDVSALVGRDRVSTNGQSSLNGSSLVPSSSSSLASANGAAGLSGKSRSGLPECATQQVCNAIFVRMNYTQKLCECSSNYNWKCSNNLDPQDGHTIELTRKFDKRIYTQIKTCEPLREVRACKSPTDWTLLALQSERSGKAHYVVVCKCPTWAQLEGPYTHNHPPYANIPGIRVYGMLCAHQTARSSAQTYATYNPALSIYPEFPWQEALNVLNTTNLLPTLNSH